MWPLWIIWRNIIRFSQKYHLKIAICLKWRASSCSSIMWKILKIVRAILERSPKTTISQHLNTYNSRLRILQKKRPVSFGIFLSTTYMQKIKKILRAVSDKNCRQTNYYLTTNYGRDVTRPFPTKGLGSKCHKLFMLFKKYFYVQNWICKGRRKFAPSRDRVNMLVGFRFR